MLQFMAVLIIGRLACRVGSDGTENSEKLLFDMVSLFVLGGLFVLLVIYFTS